MKFLDKNLIKSKFYSTYYFLKTKQVLADNKVSNYSCIQWKTNKRIPYMVAGVNEAIEIIKLSLNKSQFNSLIIKYAPEGSIVGANQCALSIYGDYALICDLENLIDGVLARRSSVATNCYKILSLVDANKIIFMSDRSDDYRMHPYDGYAAYVAGIKQFSNDSHIALLKDKKVKVFGSMPHALIHQFGGDIVKTFKAYAKSPAYDGNILVDFDNDVLKTLAELKPYFKKIKGIRLDTSVDMIDNSLKDVKPCQYGVNVMLVNKVRKYLNDHGGKHIKIVVTSNNNYDTIKHFVEQRAPIDFYGIGTYLTTLSLHFTADLVELNNKPFAKVGRKKLDESNLKIYK